MNMKNISIIILVCLISPLFSQTKLIHSIPYIEVTGEGKIELIPDEIHLSIFISEKNKKKLPLQQIEMQMIDSLSAIGISEEQLSVSDMSAHSGYSYFSQTLKTSKNYTLIVNTPAQVSQVFEKLGSIGIYDIDLTKIDHSEMEELKMKVKVNAIKSAKNKANNMMTEIGQEVGSALFIEEKMVNDPSHYDDWNYSSSRYGAAKRAVASSYESPSFTKIKLEYHVLVRFEIK